MTDGDLVLELAQELADRDVDGYILHQRFTRAPIEGPVPRRLQLAEVWALCLRGELLNTKGDNDDQHPPTA